MCHWLTYFQIIVSVTKAKLEGQTHLGYIRTKNILCYPDWTGSNGICCSMQTKSSVSGGAKRRLRFVCVGETHWSWGGSWPSDRRTPPSEASAHGTGRWLPTACRKSPWCPPHTVPPPYRDTRRGRGRGRHKNRQREKNYQRENMYFSFGNDQNVIIAKWETFWP